MHWQGLTRMRSMTGAIPFDWSESTGIACQCFPSMASSSRPFDQGSTSFCEREQ
jgi:hypothetical protein